jgi:hypothetical protein
MDLFSDILQWLLPTGGLGSIFAWLGSKILRRLQETKEVHDTYKTLYEDISETLKSLQNEVDGLHKELGRFRRSVSKMYGCRYYPDCPVQRELQNSEKNRDRSKGKKPNGQSGDRDAESQSDPDSGDEGESGADSS